MAWRSQNLQPGERDLPLTAGAAPLGTDAESAGGRSAPAPAPSLGMPRPVTQKAADPAAAARARHGLEDRLLGPVLLAVTVMTIVVVLAAGFQTG